MHVRIILYISTFIILTGCGEKPVTTPSDSDPVVDHSVPVMTAQVSTIEGQKIITAPGIVMSESEAKLSFKTGGVIQHCYVKEGDYVTKGQLLARLVLTEIDAQVNQATEASQKAERDLSRVKALYADSVATLEQLQNATTGDEIAKRTLEIATFNRAYSEIRSPIAGRVVRQMLYTGEIAGPGMPVYYIMGTGSRDWKIVAGLPDKDWASVKRGDRVEVSFDAWPGQSFEGSLIEKSSVGGSGSGTLDITIKLKQNPSELAAGMIADISLIPSLRVEGVGIPIEALIKTNGKNATVYIIEEGKAKSVSVITGELKGNQIEILSGLKKGEEVITIGSVYVEEGDKVIITNK